MNIYEMTAEEYFVIAERDRRLCKVVEEYLPEGFARTSVLFHMQQAIEKMLKALWIINGKKPNPHNSLIHMLADSSVIKDALPEELSEMDNTIGLWEEAGYELDVPFDRDEYETAKRIYIVLKETAEKYITNGQ